MPDIDNQEEEETVSDISTFTQAGDFGDEDGDQEISIEQADDVWLLRTDAWSFTSIADLCAILKRAGVPDSGDDDGPAPTGERTTTVTVPV